MLGVWGCVIARSRRKPLSEEDVPSNGQVSQAALGQCSRIPSMEPADLLLLHDARARAWRALGNLGLLCLIVLLGPWKLP